MTGLAVAANPASIVSKGTVLHARERLIVDTWQVKDGLPQNTVRGILQSRDGYIWAGTFDGLARFDGTKFETFIAPNSMELGSNRITSLAEDAEGGLWVGTENGGIGCLRGSTLTPYPWPASFPRGSISGIQTSRTGRLWFSLNGRPVQAINGVVTAPEAAKLLSGTLDEQGHFWAVAPGGLTRLIDGVCTTYLWPDGYRPQGSVALADGTVWVGSDRGVLRFRDGYFTSFTVLDGLPAGPIGPIVADAKGRVWGLNGRGGLFRIDGQKTSLPLTVWSLPVPAQAQAGRRRPAVSQPPTLHAGKDGSLWLLGGTYIGCVRGENLTLYDTGRDLVRIKPIFALLGDREGSLWLGTQGSGLLRLHPALVTTYGKEQGLIEEETQCILERKDGSLWVGTHGGGLARLAGDRCTVYLKRDGLPSDIVWSLFEDRWGTLWIGTWGGLARMAGGRITRVALPGGQSMGIVLSIFEDRRGDFWIGTFGQGLHQMRNGKAETFTMKDGLASNFVRGIHEDALGNLWFATDGGVSRFRDGAFTTFTTKDGLSDNTVRAIHEDGDGTLWFGTYGNGLNRFKDGKFTPITTKTGLFDRNVSRILDDGNGNFWMGSNRGIYHVPKAELNAFADGKISSISCVSLGRAEGMENPECNGGCQPAGCRTKDGLLWFPTAAGVVAVDPRRGGANPVPPPVVIEGVVIDGRPVDIARASAMPPGRTDVEVRYTGLSFQNPAKVRFKYKIEGFDRDWVAAGTRRVAYYTHVPPGSYRFHVIACNNDGVWNETGAAFSFTLRPHYYQTRWFFALCALAGLGALFGAHRLVLLQLRARNAVLTERTRIAREVHDGLAQGLVGVIRQIRTVARSCPVELGPAALELQQEVAKTLRLAESSLSDVRRFAHGIYSAPGLGSVPVAGGSLTAILDALVGEVGKSAGIQTSFVVEGRWRKLPGRLETNLLRITQESLSNSLKHSGCSRIDVSLSYKPWNIRLAIRDDGHGFDLDTYGTGIGLQAMRDRARSVWGELTMSSLPHGTIILIEAPRIGGWSGWTRRVP